MRVERSYLTRIVQTYDVELTPEQVEDLYEYDDIVLDGALVSDDVESTDDDDFTLRVIESPEHRVTARKRTLDRVLAEVLLNLDALVPDNHIHYAVEGVRRSVATLQRELTKRPEGVVGSES
jgi:hypothetical protein